MSKAVSKSSALYNARTGDSFSWANGSDRSTEVTSPIRIFVPSGTLTPAISAILQAGCPTIFGETVPASVRRIFPTFSRSSSRSR